MNHIALSEVCEFVKDGTHGSPVRANKEGIPVLSATNVKDGMLDFNTDRFTSIDELNIFRKRLHPKTGDVLLTIVGTLGRTAVLSEDLPLVFQRSVCVIRPNPEKLHSRFLRYALESDRVKSQIERENRGVAQIGIYLESVNKLEIPNLEFSMQEKIAAVLSCIDQAIGQTEAIIIKQQRIKGGLMQDLLTKGIDEHGNIRSEETYEFKDANFRGYKIPLDWHRFTMKHICFVKQGLQIAISRRFKEEAPNRLPYITIQFLKDPERFLEFIENPSASVTCDETDILFTRTGNTGQIITDVKGVFHNNFFKVIYDRKQILREYLINYLEWEPIQTLILDFAGTTTIPDLKHRDFYSLPLFIPNTIEEQNIIISSIKGIKNSLKSTLMNLNKLKQLKTGLMQDLLTGKVRVNALLEA